MRSCLGDPGRKQKRVILLENVTRKWLSPEACEKRTSGALFLFLMTRPRLAIIGTGISGLGCAYFLHKKYDLTLFEAANYLGGHTNTVTVEEDGVQRPIDTGFMVFNHDTYPQLCRLFDELQVQTKRPTCPSACLTQRAVMNGMAEVWPRCLVNAKTC